MDKIIIEGGVPLRGSIPISGAKNAALPIMAASLLTAEPLILSNVPHLADIATMSELLIQHGAVITMDGTACGAGGEKVLRIEAKEITNFRAPYDIVRKMRASVWVLGPLLARFGRAVVSLPGGCAIGSRPIDMHLMALKQLGAEITLEEGYVAAHTEGRLKGNVIVFDKISVGATLTAVMAAALAEGETVIENAAREPEIVDVIQCLVVMGARIEGAGTSTLRIQGVKALHGAHHRIISDRIEAGTYAIAAMMTNGDVELLDAPIHAMGAVISKLEECGASIEVTNRGLRIHRGKSIQHFDMTTQPYPGFPTDMQAQFMTLMACSSGTSVITETIFENRFMHVPELCRLGADIAIKGNAAVVRGVSQFTSAEVMATDLRASVSLVLAALVAKGETRISRVYHIDRGYERIEEKLQACGARVRRCSV